MQDSFDLVAPFYDQLASVIFGRQWEAIQMAPALELKEKEQLLIVGGGSGKILERLSSSQSITYVELSQKMLERAKKRQSDAQIVFVQADYLTWEASAKYDAILFPFFLDSFGQDNLRVALAKAKSQLKTNGELHVIDFQKQKPLKNLTVKVMYAFFKLLAGIEANQLLDFDKEAQNLGFKGSRQRSYLGDWIFYKVYST